MQQIKRLKLFLKRALPESVVGFILRLKWEKMKPIDLSTIELIRNKSTQFLSQQTKLEEELLPHLGLNNELLYQLPEELYQYTGQGLFHWQYPNQFSRYLILVSQLRISSYLEIGVRHGGTFIITVEYLQKFNAVIKAVGVDLGYSPSVVEYSKTNSAVKFFQTDSQTERFKYLLKKENLFDLVLIDGNHDEAECRSDYETVKGKAGIIVLHDVVSVICPGVKKLWQELKAMKDEFICHEFTEQYASVTARTGQTFFGIGVAIKKSYLQQKGISPEE